MQSSNAQAKAFLRMVAVVVGAGCAAPPTPPKIAGDWDAYFASGVTARPGFEGWRRMGFAHFSATSTGVTGVVRRRTGEPMVEVTRTEGRGDQQNGLATLRAADEADAVPGDRRMGTQPVERRAEIL